MLAAVAQFFSALHSQNSQVVNADEQQVSGEVPATVNAALFATYKSNEQAIEDVCHYIENNLSDIIQLPELFFVADKSVTSNAESLAQISELSEQVVILTSAQLRPFQYVCTSLVIDGVHQAVIINHHGLFARQQQLTACQRYQWSALGNELAIVELPLEQGCINIAMLTASDSHSNELTQLAKQHNVHALLVPFDIQSADEVSNQLLANAAENGLIMVAATREKGFASSKAKNDNGKGKLEKHAGFIANISSKPDDIEPLVIKHQYGKITKALLHPMRIKTKN